jgi:hypothetical protein
MPHLHPLLLTLLAGLVGAFVAALLVRLLGGRQVRWSLPVAIAVGVVGAHALIQAWPFAARWPALVTGFTVGLASLLTLAARRRA